MSALPCNVIVLDVGKTLAKLSLWDEDARLVEQCQRYNERPIVAGRRYLDVEGIERWAFDVLGRFAKHGTVGAIIPVGHGAAAAIVRDGRLVCGVFDYEEPIAPEVRADYDAQRDPFSLTGSPALPDGLNLGAQLYLLQQEQPDILQGNARILPWPQYWAWRLCGVAASEVSSLGCHTDLWRPGEASPSALARLHGWAERLAPLRRADEVLGRLSEECAARTSLSRDVRVYCGLHDSNAALHAVRAFPQVTGREATVISTGTWFVAMRVPATGVALDLKALPPSRDCLVNVDVSGRPVPSARFMGGRELEVLGVLNDVDSPGALRALAEVVRTESMALPTWVPGVGPFPSKRGRWAGEPADPAARATAAALYVALLADTSLELIGARERIVVEGRFASSEVFVRALAALRPDAQVLVNRGPDGGLPFGALRLVAPDLAAPGVLQVVAPLEIDLSNYRSCWRSRMSERSCAASMSRMSGRMA